MSDNLAGYLKFDPLLAAAIILAATLALGRLVDLVRAWRERAREKNREAQVEIAGRQKAVDAADSTGS